MKSTKIFVLFIICICILLPEGVQASKIERNRNLNSLNFEGNPYGLLIHHLYHGNGLSINPINLNFSFPPDPIIPGASMFSLKPIPELDNLLTNSWSVSFIDYNNDGFDDLFFTERTRTKACYLFKNNGGLGFSRINSGAIVEDKAIAVSSTWADVDNDGDIDPVVVNNSLNPNFFYINDGNGNLVRENSSAFASSQAYYQNASYIDYDNDGLLDLFIANYLPTRFHELWHNEGNGVFVKNELNIINQSSNQAVGATWADYDNDGKLDLFIPGSGGTTNLLFHNEGSGNFSKILDSPIISASGTAVGSCWGDIDNDGDLDLFIANNSNRNNRMFINQGNGTFVSRITGIEANNQGQSHGCSFVDVDNDADLDLYVTNDQGLKFLYLNNGFGIFTRNTSEIITSSYGFSLGQAWSDYDHDGDMDLAVSTHSNTRNFFFENNGSGNNWIGLNLHGSRSNNSAIGARIKLKSGGRWQIREINSQSGFGGQSSLAVNFGIGNATSIDSVVVIWPSGYTQTITNAQINNYRFIYEPQTAIIIGNFFADLNNNCMKEASEPFVKNYKISANEINTYSDINGYFLLPVLPGNVSALIHSDEDYIPMCDSVFTRLISNQNAIVHLGNVPIRPRCIAFDLNVSGYTTALRRGFANNYYVSVQNNGSLPSIAQQVSVNFPAAIDVVSAIPAWTNQVGANMASKSVYFSIPVLNPGENYSIIIKDSVNLTASIGQNIQIETKLNPINGDCNISNNRYMDLQSIVGAVDPNDMLSFPAGVSEHNYIRKDQEITYRIRFQNIGTYAANKVIIEDYLPNNLDISSINNFQFSHNANYSIRENKLRIEFPDIELPDSTADFEGSQGFVQFSISVLEETSAGSQIQNRASIVFDFEKPIITNEIIYTVIESNNPAIINLKIFPNPAASEFYIINPINEPVKVRVTSVFGNVLFQSIKDEAIIQINSESFTPGFYVVELVYDNKIIRKGNLVIVK